MRPLTLGWRRARRAAGWTACALLVAIGSHAIAGASTDASPHDAFDWAFRFASAIDPDPKDKSMAQEAVVLTMAMSGGLDRAVDLADDVTGWRQGTAYADLAVMLAKDGRNDEATNLLAKAQQVRAVTDGWQQGRIDAHIAMAQAHLGNRERSREISARLAKGDIQYAGRGVATVAAAHARAGDFDEAMRALATLDDETDYEVTWWRTLGYLEVAEYDSLAEDQRREAFRRAVVSARTVPGWKRGEAQQKIAEALLDFGDAHSARSVVTEAEQAVATLNEGAAVNGPIHCDLARVRARLGDTDRALELIEQAKGALETAMKIDRPAIYAWIGAAYRAAGDDRRAEQYVSSALQHAGKLVNARPRALAVVAICATLGRAGVEPDPATTARLEALYAGLRAPW